MLKERSFSVSFLVSFSRGYTRPSSTKGKEIMLSNSSMWQQQKVTRRSAIHNQTLTCSRERERTYECTISSNINIPASFHTIPKFTRQTWYLYKNLGSLLKFAKKVFWIWTILGCTEWICNHKLRKAAGLKPSKLIFRCKRRLMSVLSPYASIIFNFLQVILCCIACSPPVHWLKYLGHAYNCCNFN